MSTVWFRAVFKRVYGINPRNSDLIFLHKSASFTPVTTILSPLKEQLKTLPPETFPGLKISPKFVCCRTPLGSSQRSPKSPSWSTAGEGKEWRGKEERGKEERGKGREGTEGKNPQTKSLVTALVWFMVCCEPHHRQVISQGPSCCRFAR